MTRTIIASLVLANLIALYATNLGVLIWRSAVEDLGEGGPSFNCYFLGAMGLVRIGYFYDANSDIGHAKLPQQADCPRVCVLEKHTIRVGTRDIQAWQCATDG